MTSKASLSTGPLFPKSATAYARRPMLSRFPRALIAALIFLLLFPCRLFGWEVKGFNYTSWERDGFFQGDAVIARLSALGCNRLSLVITLYQLRYDSDSIFIDPLKTPSEGSIVHAVEQARNCGMTVFFRIQVDSKDNVWRGYFAPNSVDRWFTSYRKTMQHYAFLAESLQVGSFSIGTEYASLSGSPHRIRWAETVDSVKGYYHGPLMYCANWDEYRSVCFWDLVDQVGVDIYFPLSDSQHPSINELHHAYFYYQGSFGNRRWLSELREWQSGLGRNVFLSEVGFRSVDYVTKEPWNTWDYVTYDDRNQANAYEATFRAFYNEPWCLGICWWCCTAEIPSSGDIGWSPLGKSAESVVDRWFHGEVPELPAGDFSGLMAYPNPASVRVVLDDLPGRAEVNVYDISGRRIARFTKDNDRRTLVWDLTDDQGRRCPSGTYLLLLRCFSEVKHSRIVIVR